MNLLFFNYRIFNDFFSFLFFGLGSKRQDYFFVRIRGFLLWLLFIKRVFMFETGGNKRNTDLICQTIIVAHTQYYVGAFAGLLQKIILDDLNFIHGKLMFSFG